MITNSDATEKPLSFSNLAVIYMLPEIWQEQDWCLILYLYKVTDIDGDKAICIRTKLKSLK